MKVGKKDFIKQISKKTGQTQVEVTKTLNGLIETLADNLKSGTTVQITGFGKFEIKEIAERNGINPRTKEKLVIPASKRVHFKAGTELKDIIN